MKAASFWLLASSENAFSRRLNLEAGLTEPWERSRLIQDCNGSRPQPSALTSPSPRSSLYWHRRGSFEMTPLIANV